MGRAVAFAASVENDPCRKCSVLRSRDNKMIYTPREMPASIAVGPEDSRTDPLADTATRAAWPLGVVLIP
jgi:hypothetical protein